MNPKQRYHRIINIRLITWFRLKGHVLPVRCAAMSSLPHKAVEVPCYFLNITPDSKSDSFLPSTHFNVWLASCQRSGIFPKTNEARCLTTRGQCKITFDPYLTASAPCVIAQCQLVVNCYLCLLILKNYIIIFILYLKKRDML